MTSSHSNRLAPDRRWRAIALAGAGGVFVGYLSWLIFIFPADIEMAEFLPWMLAASFLMGTFAYAVFAVQWRKWDELKPEIRESGLVFGPPHDRRTIDWAETIAVKREVFGVVIRGWEDRVNLPFAGRETIGKLCLEWRKSFHLDRTGDAGEAFFIRPMQNVRLIAAALLLGSLLGGLLLFFLFLSDADPGTPVAVVSFLPTLVVLFGAIIASGMWQGRREVQVTAHGVTLGGSDAAVIPWKDILSIWWDPATRTMGRLKILAANGRLLSVSFSGKAEVERLLSRWKNRVAEALQHSRGEGGPGD